MKVVVKNNNPACVIITPKEYERIVEELEDYYLLIESIRKMNKDLVYKIAHTRNK